MKIKMNKRIAAIVIVIATPLIMGASCGNFQPGFSNPITDVPRDVNEVIDAHKQVGRDIGKGADAVGEWGSEFADGWNKSSTARKNGQCKPWKIMCQGSK